MRKEELLSVLRGLLDDVLRVRFEGAAYAKLARVHGYADGYMRALIDTGVIDRRGLLELVGDERRRYFEAEDAAKEAAA